MSEAETVTLMTAGASIEIGIFFQAIGKPGQATFLTLLRQIINIFIHGDLADRAARVVAEHEVDEKDAEKHVTDRDKKRSKYYRHITDQIWGAAENYDLCLNSSKLGIDGCVDLIMHCCK